MLITINWIKHLRLKKFRKNESGYNLRVEDKKSNSEWNSSKIKKNVRFWIVWTSMPESYAPGSLWNMFKCSCLEIQPNIISLPYAIISRKRKTKIIWRTKCGTVKGHDDGTYREAKNINKRSSLHLHFAIIYSFGGSEVSHNFVVYFYIWLHHDDNRDILFKK